MESIAVLALTCNVIDLVKAAKAVVNKCEKIREGGDASDGLASLSQDLVAANEELQATLELPTGAVLADDDDLYQYSKGLQCDAQDLADQVNELALDPTGPPKSKRRMVSKTLKFIRHEDRFKDLSNRLQRREQHLNTKLAVRLSQRFEDLGLRLDSQVQRYDQMLDEVRKCRDKLQRAEDLSNARNDVYVSRDLHRRILSSLHFPEMHYRKETVTDAHEKTFEWVFDEDQADRPWSNFTAWLKDWDSEHPYWISGKAGSGKSTLVQFIQSHKKLYQILDGCAGDKVVITSSAYFWMAGSSPLQKTVTGMLRTILYNLLDVMPHLLNCAFDSTFMASEWTYSRLMGKITQIAGQSVGSRRFLLVLDGLDECTDDIHLLRDTLSRLTKLKSVKMLASSRPLTPFELHFLSSPRLKLENLTKEDIGTYVSDRFDKVVTLTTYLHESDVQVLQEKVVQRSSGVFLWVKLAIDSLVEGLEYRDRFRDLQARLQELPTDLHKMFEVMVSRINKRYRDQAFTCMKLLLVTDDCDFVFRVGHAAAVALLPPGDGWSPSLREPSVQVLRDECDLVQRFIGNKCGGLLEVDEHAESAAEARIRFTHRSAFEYITQYFDWNNTQPIPPDYTSMISLLTRATALLISEIDQFTDFIDNFGSDHIPQVLNLLQLLPGTEIKLLRKLYRTLDAAGTVAMRKMSARLGQSRVYPCWLRMLPNAPFQDKHVMMAVQQNDREMFLDALSCPNPHLGPPDLNGAAAWLACTDVLEANFEAASAEYATYLAFCALLGKGEVGPSERGRRTHRPRAYVELLKKLFASGAKTSLTWRCVMHSGVTPDVDEAAGTVRSHGGFWDFTLWQFFVQYTFAPFDGRPTYRSNGSPETESDWALMELFLDQGEDICEVDTKMRLHLRRESRNNHQITVDVRCNLTFYALYSATELKRSGWRDTFDKIWALDPTVRARLDIAFIEFSHDGKTFLNTYDVKDAMGPYVKDMSLLANMNGDTEYPYQLSEEQRAQHKQDLEDFMDRYAAYEERLEEAFKTGAIARPGRGDVEFEGVTWDGFYQSPEDLQEFDRQMSTRARRAKTPVDF